MSTTNAEVILKIWDTPGSMNLVSYTPSLAKGTSGFIIIFASDDRESFDTIPQWLDLINMEIDEKVCKAIVCNLKGSIDKRKVTKEEGKELAN